MTCQRINLGGSPGIICFADSPLIVVRHDGRVYRFERSAACGLLPVNANGNERLSPVPGDVWDIASAREETLRRKEKTLKRKEQALKKLRPSP